MKDTVARTKDESDKAYKVRDSMAATSGGKKSLKAA